MQWQSRNAHVHLCTHPKRAEVVATQACTRQHVPCFHPYCLHVCALEFVFYTPHTTFIHRRRTQNHSCHQNLTTAPNRKHNHKTQPFDLSGASAPTKTRLRQQTTSRLGTTIEIPPVVFALPSGTKRVPPSPHTTNLVLRRCCSTKRGLPHCLCLSKTRERFL